MNKVFERTTKTITEENIRQSEPDRNADFQPICVPLIAELR